MVQDDGQGAQPFLLATGRGLLSRDGRIDWRWTLELLRESGYDGTLTLEVFSSDKALLMMSKNRLEELLRSGDAPWSEIPEPPSLV